MLPTLTLKKNENAHTQPTNGKNAAKPQNVEGVNYAVAL